MVGGTSMGGFVSGLYACENDYVSVWGRVKLFSSKMTSKWRQLFDITYPVTSLFTGHAFNRAIWNCFQDTLIEDCWIPYFTVTTNITWSKMEVHTTGYMWRYIRASMSLSGYLPPLCDNGSMLLDGGYINNLPGDIMRNQGASTIIAVDVGTGNIFL
jgi:lysophospholipid hydrolase